MALIRWIDEHPARAGTIAGWYQQICSALAALAVIPLITGRLGNVDAGIWFAFQAIIAILNLTDFGLSFVVARQVAFSLGASEGTKGLEGDFIATRKGWEGVSDIYYLSRRLFGWVSWVAIGLLVVIYELILPHTQLLSETNTSTASAWYLSGVAMILSLQSKPHQALLDGLGKVYATRCLAGTHLFLSGIGVITVLFVGGHLPEMAAVVAAAAAIYYVVLRIWVLRLIGRKLPAAISLDRQSFHHFIKVAIPMGVLNISGFLVSAVQVPLIGALLGPQLVPGYFVAQRISQMANQSVMQLIGPQLPIFTRQIAEQKYQDAATRLLRTATLVCLAAGVVNLIFLFGSPLFVKIWLGPGRYVGLNVLLLLALDGWLMCSAVVLSHFVLCSGFNPFVWSTLISGIFNLGLIVLLAQRFSVLGIAASSLITGLAINYWFAAFHGLRLFKTLNRQHASGK
jgi:O-antigen/teichoic acid export membrane protein